MHILYLYVYSKLLSSGVTPKHYIFIFSIIYRMRGVNDEKEK